MSQTGSTYIQHSEHHDCSSSSGMDFFAATMVRSGLVLIRADGEAGEGTAVVGGSFPRSVSKDATRIDGHLPPGK